ncbi:flagellar hook-associated protein FlgK [Acidimangrovimonas sediminis]|uniref:flagellar hook-associated protein FlgK n=1 Tax=Acidimangrovimonas sediminis TaxID=2056283 RepID=UPI000C80C0E1|nr:flagellar hook-associated protein FlgK [Acidimangrovimonas sediminis]
MSSLNSALLVSRSGLDATSVWSDATSRNIANANTAGYVRKDVSFTSLSPSSGGAVTTEIQREVDSSLDRIYRTETAKMSTQQQIYEGVQAYTAILGQPDDDASPVAKLTALQTSFDMLVNDPGDASAQQGVLDAASAMAQSLNDTSDALAQVKGEVETEIKYNVSDLNTALLKIADLNKQLTATTSGSMDSAEMQDAMGRQVEAISAIMNVQVRTDSSGRVSLYTAGGTQLVDGSSVNDLRYDQSGGKLYAGTAEITPGASGVRGFDAGSLAGLFTLKDDTFPTFQSQLDTMAAALVNGFQGADTSLSSGQAGLFTDAGAAYDPASLPGLAGRISVNAAVDPSQGGTLSRIRDGVGATSAGAASDATQVQAFQGVFSQSVAVTPATALAAGMTLGDYAANMVSYQQAQGTQAQATYTALATSAQTIDASRQSIQGVNIDDEMQKLIVIQHSYAANSKMMSAIAQMMDDLIQAV